MPKGKIISLQEGRQKTLPKRSRSMIRIALVGQPNCGKSTLFNHLVGYKATTSNLPGTTVEFLKSEALIEGERVEIVDLPGTYALTALDRAEAETRNYLLADRVDAVLNVVDASLLSRSLELTLQLLEMEIPLVVCLNMADEAKRKGIDIDAEALARRLGVPVVSAVAVRGLGVKEAAATAVKAAEKKPKVHPPRYSPDVETALEALTQRLPHQTLARVNLPPRFFAIKLLEEDPPFVRQLERGESDLKEISRSLRRELTERRGKRGEEILSAERHHGAMELFEACATVGTPTLGLRDQLDTFLMHPVLGYLLFAAIMYGFFLAVFRIGSMIETPMMGVFDRAIALLGEGVGGDSFAFFALRGIVQGMAGAIGIVLPYLIPFLIGLSVLEDIGYLPRAGYLMDTFMHRIGLHGKSVIPFILGYGCSVPAVMAPRDRFVTAMLTVMVPCVARTTIIFGLVGYFLGPHLAFSLYIINLFVIGVLGKLLTKLLPQVTPGLVLEIPSYKIPSVHVVLAKVWLRIHEFVVVAWPLLVVGSLVLSLLEYAKFDHYLNLAVLPVTWALGLPLSLGVTLLFGILRKEMSLVMLFQALGTTQVATILSAGQMMTFTLFVMFYIPCVATVAVLIRELGRIKTGLVLVSTTAVALVVALLARGIAAAFASG
jgi:ferrous iron transport protein B